MQNRPDSNISRSKNCHTLPNNCQTTTAAILTIRLLALLSALVVSPISRAQGWTEIPSSTHTMNGHAIAFDRLRGHVVGAAIGQLTHEFDGSTWSTHAYLLNPMPGSQGIAFAMSNLVFDESTQRVTCLLSTNSLTPPGFWLSDWDGVSWTHRAIPSFTPLTYEGYALCYDPRVQRLLAFPEQFNHHFYIDSTTPTPTATIAGTTSLGASATGIFVDSITAAPSVFSPATFNAPSTLFSWTGTHWAQSFPQWPFSPTSNILGRAHFTYCSLNSGAMGLYYTLDVTTGSIRPRTVRLVNGVATEQFLTAYPRAANYQTVWDSQRLCFYAVDLFQRETWRLTFGPDAQASTLGAGCPGSRGTPTLAPQQGSTPKIGTTFILQSLNLPLAGPVFLALGASDTLYGPTPLPLNLAPLGAPQCNLLVSIDNLFPSTNILGAATWGFSIPNIPGGVFFTQAVVFDAPANAFGITLSNAVRGVVGS